MRSISSRNFQRDGGTAEGKVGISGDDGQKIVEIVRDASGEAANRFHLSRLLQLRFQYVCVP